MLVTGDNATNFGVRCRAGGLGFLSRSERYVVGVHGDAPAQPSRCDDSGPMGKETHGEGLVGKSLTDLNMDIDRREQGLHYYY